MKQTQMTDEQRLAELRAQWAVQRTPHLIDYIGGVEGYTYRPLEPGPVMIQTEADLRQRGFEPAPEDDPVQMLTCPGRIRVQGRPVSDGTFQVWRIKAAWEREYLATIEASRPRPESLSVDETEEQKIARMRAEIAAFDARTQG